MYYLFKKYSIGKINVVHCAFIPTLTIESCLDSLPDSFIKAMIGQGLRDTHEILEVIRYFPKSHIIMIRFDIF